jgi:hypothetical protein
LSNLTLSVEILGEFKKLTSATKGAETSLGKLNNTASKISSGMSKAFGALGISLGAVAFVNFTKNAIRAAEEVQVADQRLNQVTKSMNLFGDNTAAVTSRLSKFANQSELLTGVTAETTKQIQATLMTFGSLAKTADQVNGSFDRATKAAIDLAAAGFGNATSNAIQLGKALNDPIKGLTSLTKSGVTFTEAERERIKVLVESNQIGEAQALILAAIEKQVGGTAEATVTSSAKMEAAFGQIEDAVGLALLPVLEQFSDWLSTNEGQETLQMIADAAHDVFTELANTAKWVIANKDWLLPLVAGVGLFSTTVKAIGTVTTAVAALRAGIVAVNAAAGAGILAGLGAGAGLLGAAAAGSAYGAYLNQQALTEQNKILFAGGTKQDPFAGLGKIGANGYVPPATKVPATSGSPRVAERGSINITINTPKVNGQDIINTVNNATRNGFTGSLRSLKE